MEFGPHLQARAFKDPVRFRPLALEPLPVPQVPRRAAAKPVRRTRGYVRTNRRTRKQVKPA